MVVYSTVMFTIKQCSPNFFSPRTGTPKINFHPRWNSCLSKRLQGKRQRDSLHGDYSSIATCCAEISAIFWRVFGIFCRISKFLLIYHTLSRRTCKDVLQFPRDLLVYILLHLTVSLSKTLRKNQSLYYPTNAHNVKNAEVLKRIKIMETAPTCFGVQRNHHQGATAST